VARLAGPLLACALLAACTGDDEQTPAPPSNASPVATAPAPGTLEVSVRDGRASILAQGVSRRAVLERLAETAGFSLEIFELPRARVSLRIEDAPLAAVLPQLLEGAPYRVEYDVDAETGVHRLARLGVGSGSPAEAPIAAENPAAQRKAQMQRASRERAKRRAAARSAETRAEIEVERNRDAEAREPELLRQLEDPDPSIRAEAVLDLPIDEDPARRDERLERLAGLVSDPESVVRQAAVERLGDLEGPGALDALLPALNDTNHEVVIEAISSIEDLDDAAAIPHLKPLLQDRDPDVREAAEFAIDWLQD